MIDPHLIKVGCHFDLDIQYYCMYYVRSYSTIECMYLLMLTYTMCDFHDFDLTFFSVFVLLKMSKNVFWVVARLPQRLKSTFFEIFSSLHWSLQGRSIRKIFKKR